jgi:hypothetical protein
VVVAGGGSIAEGGFLGALVVLADVSVVAVGVVYALDAGAVVTHTIRAIHVIDALGSAFVVLAHPLGAVGVIDAFHAVAVQAHPVDAVGVGIAAARTPAIAAGKKKHGHGNQQH